MKRFKYSFILLTCCCFFSWVYPELFFSEYHQSTAQEFQMSQKIQVKSYLYKQIKRWLGNH